MIKLGKLKVDPVAIGSQGNAILGIRDSGKTYTATWLAERLFESGIPFIAFDPIGVWRFLRVPGKGNGYPVVVAGGTDGDLPLTVAGAPEIVRAAMANGVSLVIDLFDINLSKADWKRIVTACVRVLLHENSKHGLRHVFIEEAAEFAPQRVGPDQGQVYAEMEKLARMGGNARLGYTLINQRAEEVNKALLELCDNLFLHRQKGRNSLTALSKWLDIGNVTAAKQIVSTLPTLPTGECWAWLQGSETPELVKIPAKNSLHPDRRVMRGDEPALAAKAVDVGSFVATMKGTLGAIEQEVKTLAELKAELAQLRRQKDPTTNGISEFEVQRRVREAVANERERHARNAVNAPRAEDLVRAEATLRRIAELASKALAATSQPRAIAAPDTPNHARNIPKNIPRREPSAPRDGVSGPEQRILDALVDLSGIGIDMPQREQVAFLAGYSHLSSKGFSNGVGALNSGGLISYPERGRIRIEEPGRERAKPEPSAISNEDLHDRICTLLGGATARILRPLIAAYPRAMERSQLAAEANYGHTSSKGFSNAIGRLRTLGLIDYPERGTVVARDILFPKGKK